MRSFNLLALKLRPCIGNKLTDRRDLGFLLYISRNPEVEKHQKKTPNVLHLST